jgi:bacillopeptidase F (M6 metalloprotease family)
LSNDQVWQTHTFDLSAYAGQTIRLHFGVYNDGLDGRTAVYIDNAALVIEQADIWTNKVFLPAILKE